VRYDIYRIPHKGQRRALALLGIAIGRLNPGDEGTATTLAARVHQLIAHIRDHSANEDRFVTPLYSRSGFDPATLDAGHHAVDALMAEVSAQLRSGALRRSEHAFYRLFYRFVAAYLTHLEEEEAAQVAHLWPHFSDEELIEAQATFVASRSPMSNLADLSMILPSLNIDETVVFLSALKRDVPAEPFGMILALAKRALEPQVWSAIEARLKQW
jgi:hypothetical protein